jgi:hypothetical protein
MNGGGRTHPKKTYTNEDAATTEMTQINRAQMNVGDRTELVVLVDGPGDGEFTIMRLAEAIDNGFIYRWAV